MNYDNLFTTDEHYITIVGDKFTQRFEYYNNNQIMNILNYQKGIEDIYISKYPKNKKVKTIILDFDGENHDDVFKEVLKLHNYLKVHKINSVIIDSSNKGFHIYIQIPCTIFKPFNKFDKKDMKNIFNIFVYNLINDDIFKFEYLDEVNTKAGLGGNIRLIGSIHPKSSKRVEIVTGEFITNENYDDYVKFNKFYVKSKFFESIKYYNMKLIDESNKVEKGNELINKNDLRQLLPSLYPSEVRDFGDYITMLCPFHNDHSPSMMVTKDWFYCWTCESKGNVWSLIKKGIINFSDVD